MNKRFWWLKISNKFFSSKVIKKLRKMPGGDTLTIIYLRLQLLALQTAQEKNSVVNGVIEFEGLEEDIEAEIALELEENFDTVKMLIAYLAHVNLIELTENGNCIVKQIAAGSEGDSAERTRKYRVKGKETSQCDVIPSHCDSDVTECAHNVTAELESRNQNLEFKKSDRSDQSLIDEIEIFIKSAKEKYNFDFTMDQVEELMSVNSDLNSIQAELEHDVNTAIKNGTTIDDVFKYLFKSLQNRKHKITFDATQVVEEGRKATKEGKQYKTAWNDETKIFEAKELN
ncbi:MAG: phage replisome organizer N-terminal domain-containing protein [Schwartzia sp.]|nr:phage replisome organizer N-terminal domain-containing protein [Schwartzia sp. (in: firmicutes)]